MNRTYKLVAVLVSAIVVLLALTLSSVGQDPAPGPETNTSTNRSAPAKTEPTPPTSETPRAIASPPAQDFANAHWDIPADADKKLNPVTASEESVAKGKELYLARKGNCVFCHGESGAGNKESLPKLRRKPADLTNKERMTKMSDGEIFWKISLGIPGIMPGREKQLTEEERWNVVNYVRTLAKKE